MTIALRALLLVLLITLLFLMYDPAGAAADEIEEAPVDQTISNICTPSDCSPAKPCAEKDEMCYTLNGAFYCCFEPPGGAEAVGE